MPELPVKEVRLPELHLPEIDREQIVNSLSGLRLPAIEIPTVERPRFGRQRRSSRFDWRSVDLGPALAGAAALVRVGSRARPLVRTRWAIVAGVVVVTGLAAAALMATPAVRERAGRTVRDVRARIDGAIDNDLMVEADLADTEADVETIAEDVVKAADKAADEVEATIEDPAETIGTAG
jgi:hypothetical protein